MASINREFGICIAVLVGTREFNQRPRGAVAAVCDTDLDTGDVVLWLINMRAVNT
jgi:hypothetical protein